MWPIPQCTTFVARQPCRCRYTSTAVVCRLVASLVHGPAGKPRCWRSHTNSKKRAPGKVDGLNFSSRGAAAQYHLLRPLRIKSAKAIGVTISIPLLGPADEVIE